MPLFRRHGRCRLRHEVFGRSGSTVVKRPPVNGGKLRTKVAVTRWTWHFPFQRRCLPRIVFSGSPAREDAREEFHKEQELSRRQEERREGDEYIEDLLRLQKLIVQRVVDTPHLATDSDDMHREEHTVRADETHPEMDLAGRFIH